MVRFRIRFKTNMLREMSFSFIWPETRALHVNTLTDDRMGGTSIQIGCGKRVLDGPDRGLSIHDDLSNLHHSVPLLRRYCVALNADRVRGTILITHQQKI